MSTRPEIEFRPIDRRNPASIWLQKHRANVKSQSGEDGVIAKIFEVVGTENRFCVDFGAGDGQRLSNSYNLTYRQGWKGVLIEPGASFVELAKLYEGNRNVAVINDIVGFDPTNTLDAHLLSADLDVPSSIDFVSIDIDGCDVHVWEDLEHHRARVVCIEFNHFIPLDVYLLPPRDLGRNIGASLLATADHAREMGYELVATTAMNAFFVDRPLFPKFDIPDNSVSAMHFLGTNETKLARAYDGTLYIAGLDRDPWKGFKIDEERIQPLPSNMRRWKFDTKIFPTKKL